MWWQNTAKGRSILRLRKAKVEFPASFSNLGLFCATEPNRFPAGLLQVLPIDHIALPAEWANITLVVSAWPADKAKLSDHSGMVVEVIV